MQYVKGKKPIICQFSAPTADTRPRLQADVIQGRPINKQWNPSQLGSAVRDYHKWRVFGRDLFMGDSAHRTAEDNAINLDTPHPPLSPMSAQKLKNDDTLRDFSDTLFISTEKKHFTVPAPKKITRHVYNSDIIQPGLMQLDPDFDEDFMETLDSLQDILGKTPTKQDTDSLGINYSLPPNFLADTSLGSFSEAMEIADTAKNFFNGFPIGQPIITSSGNNTTKQVFNQQRSVTFAAAPPTIVSCGYDPMVSSVSLSDFSAPPMYQTYSQAAGQASGQIPNLTTTGQVPSQTTTTSRSNMQLPNLTQMQGVTSSTGSGSGGRGGQLSPQQSLPMVTTCTSYQQQRASAHPTSSVASNQGFTYTKLGAHSPTPTSPPGCTQSVTMNQGPISTMGVINEAIGLLSGQITTSPSKLPPDWTAQFAHPLRTTTWAPTSSQSSVDITSQLKTSMAEPTFLTYQQIQRELTCTMDPMAHMDQSTVLGHSSYGGSMSSGQPHHPHHQVASPGHHQVASPGHHQVPSPQQHSAASTQQHSVASPQQYSVVLPQQHSERSPQPHHVTSPHPREELMDYEQFPSSSVVGVSGLNAYCQPKREVDYSSRSNSKSNSKANSRANSRPNSRPSSRSNSRASSRANSPRASYAGMPGHFQDSLQAALQGKSDVKEPGLRSPSTDRDLTISVPSSRQASAASSAASSPGSQIEYPDTPTSVRECEFHAPRAKKQKTPDSGSKDKDARRRIKHLHSEHKRRFNIQTGLDEIQSLIPGMKNGSNDNNSSKTSTATMLQKAHEYMMHLKDETISLRKEVEKTREEIEKVNNEICDCQDSLPDTGAPVNSQSERQLQLMCNEYINQQMKDNWKWWIFSMIAKPLFTSYVVAVCTSPGGNFDEDVLEWVEESCRLKPLRKLVYKIVRQVSTRTSVLLKPVQLPQEVREIIKKEIENPASTEQS